MTGTQPTHQAVKDSQESKPLLGSHYQVTEVRRELKQPEKSRCRVTISGFQQGSLFTIKRESQDVKKLGSTVLIKKDTLDRTRPALVIGRRSRSVYAAQYTPLESYVRHRIKFLDPSTNYNTFGKAVQTTTPQIGNGRNDD
ncbi:hypothetical protein H2199_003211 [Coniosporium tulheliwenetii]|uniref:Uncharacterized protein n=1 Tax=Coniosporium tulheliwenetii TaxID=3383036 RepID=A0ACC2ZD43_9PEZI|nr:hypothetical protein H2199_003211 [Cladosporium sp. JES 115]